ncbi:MAG: HAD family hydrolase [Anaerorhabdus sp.]
MIELIIWDWNGTLLDDLDLGYSLLNDALRNEGLNELENISKYKNVFEFPVIEMYRKLGFNCDEKNFDKISSNYIQNYMKSYEASSMLHNEAIDLLQYFMDKGIKNTLMSASQIKILLKQASFFKCDHLFDELVGVSDIYASSKQDEALNWIKTCDVPLDRIVWVGDSTHDYECAVALGVRCILIDHGHQSYEVLSKCNNEIIHNLNELKEKLA